MNLFTTTNYLLVTGKQLVQPFGNQATVLEVAVETIFSVFIVSFFHPFAMKSKDIFSIQNLLTDLFPHAASRRTLKTPACRAHQPCLLYQSMSHNAFIWMESAAPSAEIRKNREQRWICIASWVIFPQSSHQCASPHDRVTFYISMLMWWAFARPGSLISRMSLHALGLSHKLDHSVCVCVPSPLCSKPAPWGVMTAHFTHSLLLQCRKDAKRMLRLHGTVQSWYKT